jgi:nucleoside 2-deoxyribosyltransferase
VKPKVYLAGPITGLDYNGATDWRVSAREDLKDFGIEGVSPMRAKEYLLQETRLLSHYDDHALSSQKAITVRDRNDVIHCHGMIANLLEAERVSIGTCIEYGWADAFRKPIVTVMELHQGNFHDHAMIRELSGSIVPTLEEAIHVMARWLL